MSNVGDGCGNGNNGNENSQVEPQQQGTNMESAESSVKSIGWVPTVELPPAYDSFDHNHLQPPLFGNNTLPSPQQQQQQQQQTRVIFVTNPVANQPPVDKTSKSVICFAWFWAAVALFTGGLFCSIPALVFASSGKYKQSIIISTIGIIIGVTCLIVILSLYT